MSESERLSIDLPAPIADAVHRAVQAGEYASPSDVVREALSLWEARRRIGHGDRDVLRRAWDAGKASGTAGPLDIGRLIAEERAKLENFSGNRG